MMTGIKPRSVWMTSSYKPKSDLEKIEFDIIADLAKKTGSQTLKNAEENHRLAQMLVTDKKIDELGFLWVVIMDLIETCLTLPGDRDDFRREALSALQTRLSRMAANNYRPGG